jgi:hypothetical protein
MYVEREWSTPILNAQNNHNITILQWSTPISNAQNNHNITITKTVSIFWAQHPTDF